MSKDFFALTLVGYMTFASSGVALTEGTDPTIPAPVMFYTQAVILGIICLSALLWFIRRFMRERREVQSITGIVELVAKRGAGGTQTRIQPAAQIVPIEPPPLAWALKRRQATDRSADKRTNTSHSVTVSDDEERS